MLNSRLQVNRANYFLFEGACAFIGVVSMVAVEKRR